MCVCGCVFFLLFFCVIVYDDRCGVARCWYCCCCSSCVYYLPCVIVRVIGYAVAIVDVVAVIAVYLVGIIHGLPLMLL